MRLRVNGRDVELTGPARPVDYLAGLGVDPRSVAVELNDRILERAEIATAQLQEGDVVEIVRMVGGGNRPARDRPAQPHAPPTTGADRRDLDQYRGRSKHPG